MRHTLLRPSRSAIFSELDCRASEARASVRPGASVVALFFGLFFASFLGACGHAQMLRSGTVARAPLRSAAHKQRAGKFLAGRSGAGFVRGANALASARQQHLAMLALPRAASLTASWQPVGPPQIGSLAYGNVTGRITAIAIDPSDTTGNTVYIGTTGGGVWKSTNAAGASPSVTFKPLTDTLPVFSPEAGGNTIPSLSIGALSIANGVILAGTGDPNDALDSYYGSGILRSADGGATWTLVHQSQDGVYGTHSFMGLGFAGFAWSGASSGIAVAAVSDAAEGELVNAPSGNQSVRGLYYSNDAGVTWQMAVIMDGSQIVQTPLSSGLNYGGNAATSVVWNPIRRRFYAAIRFHGYYESVDGSVWTRLAVQPGTGLTSADCPANPGVTGSTDCPIFRGTLAVEAVSGDTYAFTVDDQLIDKGIWRDVCSATNSTCSNLNLTFGSRLNTTPLEEPDNTIPQGDYDLSLAAVATGSDTLVFAGTVDLYRCSLAAGCTFRNTTNTEDGCSAPALVAPSQHAITILPGAAPLLYLGNDGGLWRSADGVNQKASPCSPDDATHFQNLNGGLGSLAEVVNFSQHPTDPDTVLVGVGVNGTAAISDASARVSWPQLAAGEGGLTAIDPVTSANLYISTGPGVSIAYCGKGAACTASDFDGQPTVGPAQLAEDDALIDAPWLLDPALLSDVIIGTCRVWRGPATNGSSWSTPYVLSPEFGGPQNPSCDLDNSYVRSLAAGGPATTTPTVPNAGSEVLYAGLAGVLDGGGTLGGHILSTTTANSANSSIAWSDLALSPVSNDGVDNKVFNPYGFDISSVFVDPHDATGATVYATVMGFSGNGLNVPHVYRSTDAGGHWANVTANLPNAPANGVAVDPNDANTVYVALDTGVYATAQIASCATQSCWSVMGVGLPNAPIVQLSAAAALPAGGSAVGILRAASYGRGIWQIPLLTAAAPSSAKIATTPASLTFATQVVGSASPPQNITLINTGNAPLTVTSLSTTGDFQETDNCAGVSLVSGASCMAQVVFHATTTGSASGLLTFFANISGGQATATLSGVGVAPASVVLSPLSLNFGTVTVGQTAAPQSVTVSNTGGATATLQPPVIAGDFQISANTCGATLASGVGCTLAITFSPVAAGTRNGSLSIADSAGTQLASLTGSGASVATDILSPTVLTFTPQLVGTSSAAQTVTVTNSGDTILTLIAAQITSGAFTVVNGCGSSLNGHAACTLEVAFDPTASGSQTGTLIISDEFRSQTISLSGVGLAPPGVQLSPNSLTFGPIVAGQSDPAQNIAVSNSGSGQITIGSIAVSGPFTESDNCVAATLAGTQYCLIRITFTPTAAGIYTGSLTVPGSSAGQQATALLAGTGLAPAAVGLAPGSLSFGALTIGSSSAAQNIAVSNTGGISANLAPPTTSGDFILSANTCTNTLAPSTGCTVAVVFKPTASGMRYGTFSIGSSSGTETAALSGTGDAPATDGLTPASLSFTPQQVGTSSPTQAVTLTNTGDNTLTLIAVQVTGGNFTATSSCGTSLVGHSACTIAVASSPVANGPVTGLLTVSDQFRSQTLSLSGTGVAPPTIGLSPAALSFSGTSIGQSSTAETIQISNAGGGQLTVTSVAISGDFTEADTCAGKQLTGTATCTVQIIFSPAAATARSGLLTVSGSEPGSSVSLQATAALSGSGQAPAFIVLDPISESFGTVTLGSSSTPPLNITISNTGGVPAALQTPTISGDFAITANTCGTTLAASTGCTVAVTFTPTASGLRTGTLSISDSVGTQSATLMGIGAAPATDVLSPVSLIFAPQQTYTPSPTQPVTLTNNGDNALTLISVQVSGGNFTAANGCGTTLSGHASCTIAVASDPAIVGAVSGVLTVSDQFKAQTVALSGTGVAPPGISLSPSAGLTFAATGVAEISAAQTVTLSNQGGLPLTISGLTVTGDFTLPTSLNTCVASVAPGSSCTLQIAFAPTAAGARAGALSVADNAAGSPQTLTLQGEGVDFTLNANGAASVTVASGGSTVFPLLMTSITGTPGVAGLSCAGAPLNSICTVVPSSVPLGGTTTLTATVETGIAASALIPGTGESRTILWAAAFPVGFFGLWLLKSRGVRSIPRGLLVAFGAACLLCASGCGSGRTIPGGPGGGGTGPAPPLTPSGTYTITVSGTSAGLTRSVALTLVVE